MGKQSKRPGRRDRKRYNSPLSAHTQQGRIFKPPIKSLPNLREIPWPKHTLPDMLWLCSVLATNEEIVGIPIIARTLNVIDGVIGSRESDDVEDDFPVMDGRLSSLEHVPEEAWDSILSDLVDQCLYDSAMPEGFAHALAMHPNAPGRWLLKPWMDRNLSVDGATAEAFLRPVIAEALDGRGRVAIRAKAIVVGRYFRADKITVSADANLPLDLFPKYPFMLNKEELRTVDSFSRAMFMGLIGAKAENEDCSLSEEWAQSFWRSNWRIYRCSTNEASMMSTDDTDLVSEATREYSARAVKLHEAFLDVALKTDPDLFAPDRYEVLTGIASRALRLAAAAASTPILWSGEHGAPIVRSLVESLIVLRWLLKRDDPTMYSRFKDYGRGRLKLLKLHVEEYVDSLDDPPPGLQEYVAYLDAEVNREVSEEWQNVSIETTFSAVSARAMAIEVGMEREYRLQFTPASSATHGEWSSLDRYVLERCQNPLHGGHRIPLRTLSTPIGAQLVDTILDLTEDLVLDYIAGVRKGMSGEGNA